MQYRYLGSALLVAALLVAAAQGAEEPEIPYETRKQLEDVLRLKTSRIDQETTADGLPYRRGTYAKRLVPLSPAPNGPDNAQDDGEPSAYQVSYIKDAPGPEVQQTDRFLLTITRDRRGSRAVTDEERISTYRGLVRTTPGDETFHSFQRLNLDREGLHITAGPGTLIIDYLQGQPHRILIGAKNLAYRYAPPAELGFHQHDILVEDNRTDFVFKPQLVTIDCVPGSCESFLAGGADDAIAAIQPIDRKGLTSALAKHYTRWLAREARERKANPFKGFRRAPEIGHPYYSLAVKRRDDHRIRLDYDTWNSDEVVFSATDFGPLYSYPSAASRQGISEYDLERREDRAALDYDLVALKGDVGLALGDAEEITGDLTFTLRIKRHLQELPFNFRDLTRFLGRPANDRNPAITINGLQDADGNDMNWVRTGVSSGLVILPEEAAPNDTIVLSMQFQNRGSILQISPSYSYVDRYGWLPFVRLNDAIDEFDLTVRAPARYKVIGAGTQVSETTEASDTIKDGINVTRWVAQNPVRFPTLIFGDYVTYSPQTVAEKSDGTQIPVTIQVDKHAMTDWGIRPKQLQPLAEQAVNALNIYRTLFGVDYPYGKLDLVNDFSFNAAQSPGSTIYLGNAVFRSSTTLAGVYRNPDEGRALSRVYVAREVANQWWGAVIGAANAKNQWFVEALAEYSAALFAEIVAGEGYRYPDRAKRAYLEHVARWRNQVLEFDPLTSVQHASTLWTGRGYRAALHAKGPYAFHMLRTSFGDEKFFEFLNRMGQQLAGQEVVGRDIQRIAETSLGGIDDHGDPYRIDLEWFFDQWIRGVGVPEYTFEHRTRVAEDGKFVVEGSIRQRVLAGRKKHVLENVHFKGMVPITVLGSDKREYGTQILVDGAATPFMFKVPVRPLEVSLNKYGETLAHEGTERSN